MERARLIEIIGSFLLGGGVVAMAYELGRGSSPEVTSVASVADDGQPGAGEGGEGGAATPSPYAEGGERAGDDERGGDGAGHDPAAALPPWMQPDERGVYQAFTPIYETEPVPFDAAAEAMYPAHGLVTSLAVIVRERPELTAPVIGVLNAGTRIRTDKERTFGGGCEQGWNKVFPRGFICRLAGLRVEDAPPAGSFVVASVRPSIDQALPYEYWRVKDETTPFFHRLPTFNEQDQADKAGAAWYAKHGRRPMPTSPAERPADVPSVVKEYMNAGYYVTKGGEEVRMERRFLRTLRGAYARKYQLLQKESPTFRGRVLPNGEADLPIHFIVRQLPLMRREAEGSDVLVESDKTPERLSTHPFVDEVFVGNNRFYVDGDGLLMRSYAVGKAAKVKRPPSVGPEERWVHIDLSEQTLVAYDGERPVFATLVSTGKVPGMTPVGVHRVQTKLVAASMRDQPEEDEAYSIDDVPWTQYFSGSVALHGAFWHAGFGQVRSHGCVNLSPHDARWLFGFTQPALPPEWHAVAPTKGTPRGSPVVVTE
jgi:hypothetical protein